MVPTKKSFVISCCRWCFQLWPTLISSPANYPAPTGKFTLTVTAFIRWDERAGLRRDAIRSQLIDVLEAQRKGDRQCRRLALCGPEATGPSEGSSRLGWIWEIVRVFTVF